MPGRFPAFTHYFPGDHKGCVCDFEPILSTPKRTLPPPATTAADDPVALFRERAAAARRDIDLPGGTNDAELTEGDALVSLTDSTLKDFEFGNVSVTKAQATAARIADDPKFGDHGQYTDAMNADVVELGDTLRASPLDNDVLVYVPGRFNDYADFAGLDDSKIPEHTPFLTQNHVVGHVYGDSAINELPGDSDAVMFRLHLERGDHAVLFDDNRGRAILGRANEYEVIDDVTVDGVRYVDVRIVKGEMGGRKTKGAAWGERAGGPDVWQPTDAAVAAEKRISALGKIIDDEAERRFNADPTVRSLRATLADLTEEYDGAPLDSRLAISRQMRATVEKIRDARPAMYKEVLNEVRPMGVRPGGKVLNYAARSSKPAREAIDRAGEWYPTAWTDITSKVRPFRAVKSADRGYHLWDARFTNKGAEGELSIAGAEGAAFDSTAIHELGHAMEQVIPGLQGAEFAFMYRRTLLPTGRLEPLKWLGPGYKDFEVARDDAFRLNYSGKQYDLGGPDASWELFTTGAESLFGSDPHAIAARDDNDYRRFILGVLAAL